MKRRRRLPRRGRGRATADRHTAPPRRAEAPAVTGRTLRTVLCGAAFVVLVALKLLLPETMAGVRATVGRWLVRDADFASAFSAVGRAVSGEAQALEDAYVAVFGTEEAQEVSGAAEVDEPVAPEYPEHTTAERRELGFAFAAPLNGVVTSPFGWRIHPDTGAEAFHYGVDIAAEEGADITAFADGTVGVVADSVELGRYLTVHHTDGKLTLYAHCSRITAESGSEVKCGDKLAEVGHTGNATGPHLHFEVRDGEEWLDPQLYL